MDLSERRKRATQEATQWWFVLDSEPTQAERERYTDWLRESPVHIAEMMRIARVQQALELFEEWPDLPPYTPGEVPAAADRSNVISLPLDRSVSENSTAAAPSQPKRERSPRRTQAPSAVAAVLCCIAVGAAWFYPSYVGKVVQTEQAERHQLTLTDGSEIELDPQTRLRIRFGSDSRRVYLEHGRALFRVASDPGRPFLVQTDDTAVRALGTAFAVERQPQAVVVTVAEGKVAVFNTLRPQAPAALSTKRRRSSDEREGGSAPVYLTANQQLTVDRSGTVVPVHNIDSHRALAWADGKLVFQDDPIATAVAEFNRYNRIQLRVNDPLLANRPVTGTFNASEPESFAAFIQFVAGARISRSDTAVITLDTTR